MNAAAGPSVKDDVITEMGGSCMLMRTRLISRVVTAIYDEELRPLGVGSPQFALLVVIYKIEPATRADIGRFHHQDRSTLTRNLKVMLAEGWIEEVAGVAAGRGRPVVVTRAGKDLLLRAGPAWHAGQAKAKALLGDDGVTAVMGISQRIMTSDPQP